MQHGLWNRWITGGALVAAGIVIGSVLETSTTAQSRFDSTPPPPVAFKSGGQMSVPILKDISATLRKMDERLANLETAAKSMQSKRTTSNR